MQAKHELNELFCSAFPAARGSQQGEVSSRARFPAGRGFQQCEVSSSATHPALRAPLSERGWLRSPLIGRRLHAPTNIQAATATSPLGEGCPKGGVCRTVNPNITNITAKAFIPNITNITRQSLHSQHHKHHLQSLQFQHHKHHHQSLHSQHHNHHRQSLQSQHHKHHCHHKITITRHPNIAVVAIIAVKHLF